jgi:hypothetical protein
VEKSANFNEISDSLHRFCHLTVYQTGWFSISAQRARAALNGTALRSGHLSGSRVRVPYLVQRRVAFSLGKTPLGIPIPEYSNSETAVAPLAACSPTLPPRLPGTPTEGAGA